MSTTQVLLADDDWHLLSNPTSKVLVIQSAGTGAIEVHTSTSSDIPTGDVPRFNLFGNQMVQLDELDLEYVFARRVQGHVTRVTLLGAA